MPEATATLEARSFDNPDELRTPDKTRVEVLNWGHFSVGRFTFEPGWTWESCVKPSAGTDHCEKEHYGYCVSGELEVWTPEGEHIHVTAGNAYHIAPNHDAKVVGSEPFVGIEWNSADTYAKN